MKESITQESDYGCGIACFAFATDLTFTKAAEYLGKTGVTREGVPLQHMLASLNSYGLSYVRKYVKPHLLDRIGEEGTIVLTKRSKDYPVGHYLVRHEGIWMDPWINMLGSQTIEHARSGFRKELPGEPMYAVFPVENE
jgi:hypothetical protein